MNNNQNIPDRLEGNEGKNYARQYLVKLKIDAVNWQTLWKNPASGEFWKEYFPMPEMHGGGPPVFRKITEQEAQSEFGVIEPAMNRNTETPERLEGNAGKEFAKQHLVRLKADAVNGKILWKNQTTGDFWKEYFPWPEAHGDGPSVFVKISAEQAETEFRNVP